MMRALSRFVTTIIATVAVAFFITSCATAPRNTTSRPDENQFVTGNSVAVIVEFVDGTIDSRGWFSVTMRFRNQSLYRGLVQEIWNEDGTTLVEYFTVPLMGTVYDFHSGSGVRMMLVYPADQEGMDLRRGWGHVPQNRDGSMMTTVGPNFNAEYQRAHRTTGRIVADDRARVATWMIRDGVVYVAGTTVMLKRT